MASAHISTLIPQPQNRGAVTKETTGAEMAGTEEERRNSETPQSISCRFEWDEESKLYFHASSGFYHDPNAGWYYSTRDGLYYAFENGSYVPLTCNEDGGSKDYQHTGYVSSDPIQDGPCSEDIEHEGTESYCPPSQWLEETLIDLYLSGYSNSKVDASSSSGALQTDGDRIQAPGEILPDHLSSDRSHECYNDMTFHHVEQGERNVDVIEDVQEATDQCLEEELSSEEKIWQAQYGQVVSLEDRESPSYPAIDLWDWEIVEETMRKTHQVFRLIGRLVKRSAKLHPSVPSRGCLIRTTPIRGVHLDLVCVASGKVYRLRSPSTKYLASLSQFDASNPTKDWGFSDLYIVMHNILPVGPEQTYGYDISKKVIDHDSSAIIDQVPSSFDKHKPIYRDRASERRILYGGFSIGPGQKESMDGLYGAEMSTHSSDAETAAASAEALYMSFGSGSYGRRIIERMGWKDGNSLGRSNNGIVEPLQAVGNKGQAGLGWSRFSSGP